MVSRGTVKASVAGWIKATLLILHVSQHVHVQGAQPVMPEYRPEDMVFEMEEEKIPVYNPPKPADDDDDDDDAAAAHEGDGATGALDFMLHRRSPQRILLRRLLNFCILGASDCW